jgi:hypothetical protein
MEIFFYKGKDNALNGKIEQGMERADGSDLKKIQDAFLKVLDNKNLSLLLGSGCSSYRSEETAFKEVGIPVMAPLAEEFYGSDDFKAAKLYLKTSLDIDVDDPTFAHNLENFLSTLHSLSFYHSKKTKPPAVPNPDVFESKKLEVLDFSELNGAEKIEAIITMARNFLLQKCLNETNVRPDPKGQTIDAPLLELYKLLYRKLLTRNSTLPRLNIFTTNYDLYSERAMDLLGVHYVNGFTGGISKYFNPAIFNYALAEKMDLSQSKWSVIDNFFYLYKIHGSINWIEAEGENKLFKVKEIQDPTFDHLKGEANIMIHPTPLKYNASLGSPYSDLFREFQKKLMQNNNILVTIGYSFSDEHINNIIFQAFTIPSFRLIVIGEPTPNNAIGKLMGLNDSRIWIIGERWPPEQPNFIPLHYFKRFINEIMPDLTAEDLDKKMEKTIQNLKTLLK